jgi:hypothetical protein
MIDRSRLLTKLNADMERKSIQLGEMDEECMEHDYMIGEIQYIEYLIEWIERGNL